MRHAARVDDNQKDIVKALRNVGCTVESIAGKGSGCPDLLVGHQGRNILFEVKDGSKHPCEQRLTPSEENWHAWWQGEVHVVHDADEALAKLWGRK